MKFKATKICAAKGCNNEFKMNRTTDKYCSPACAYGAKPIQKPAKSIAIKTMSEKRRRESYTYAKKRRIFLEKRENKVCIVAKIVFNKTLFATEIHHKAGRVGKLLNYVPYWLAVSRDAHVWIHENPDQAYKLGFLIHSSTAKAE